MESKKNTPSINAIVADLAQKVLLLQEKIDFLCRSTGNCELINKVHSEVLSQKTTVKKEVATNGINIDTLCKEE
ncbi:MAG: hypothetical protein CMI54_03030 [Parcubacteria group bacterium]|nr:hypothetical protein [Parcubacteria group bacterium]|tara:strand:- start:1148 stop:1369 length:222 start_codon:yes stop_codon:yes gene_type:complete